MAVITYGGKAIIPGPFVAIQKQYNQGEDSRKVGVSFAITLKGRLVAGKGSPDGTKSFWTSSGYPPDETLTVDQNLGNIIRKQEAIRELFASDGQVLEITPWDGVQAPLRCNPVVRDISFSEGAWFNTCDYAVVLDAEVLYGVGADEDANIHSYHVSKASEEWNVERGDDKGRFYRLTHSVSAVGKRFFSSDGTLAKEAWERGRDWVLSRLGINAGLLTAPGVLDLDLGGMSVCEYVRAQRVDERSGLFTVTESWVAVPGSPALDEYTVSIQTGEDQRSRVRVEGTITGYETRNNSSFALTSSRYANASTLWSSVQGQLFGRAGAFSGLTLYPTPVSKQDGHNEKAGTVSYNFEYDDRAAFFVAGAISENVTVQDNFAAQVFATVPVLGRAIGPVLQDVGTKTAKRRTISVEVQLPAARHGFTPTQPSTGALVTQHYPPSYSQLFVDGDAESWSDRTGRYSRTVSLTYQ